MLKGILLDECKNGHSMIVGSKNVWVRPCDGARYCRICMKETRDKYRGTMCDGYDIIDPRPRGSRSHLTPVKRYKEGTWYNDASGRRLLWSDLFPPKYVGTIDERGEESF